MRESFVHPQVNLYSHFVHFFCIFILYSLATEYELNKILKRRNYCQDKIATFLEDYEFHPVIINLTVEEKALKTEEDKNIRRYFGKLQKDFEFLSKLSEIKSFNSNRTKFSKCQQIRKIAGETLDHLKNILPAWYKTLQLKMDIWYPSLLRVRNIMEIHSILRWVVSFLISTFGHIKDIYKTNI